MSKSNIKRVIVCTTILAMFIAIVLPSAAFGQNRGRGQDKRYERQEYRGGGNYRRDKRKQQKFVNGHDARDGRWDGRGPRRNRMYTRSYRQQFWNRNSNLNRRRQYSRDTQYWNDSRYDDYDYRDTNSFGSTKGLLGGILGNILSGQ